MNYLLLLLPVLAQGGDFNIRIVASTDKTLAKAEVTGYDEKVISDKEIETFKIGKSRLYSAVTKVFNHEPTNVYLKSPTPWGDLYKKHGWEQVTRTLTPKQARIIGITSQPVIVTSQEFENNSTDEVKFTAAISQSVEDSVSNSWSKGGELSVSSSVTVSVDVGVGSVSGTTSLGATASFGEEFSKSKTYTVGSTTGIEVSLKPGKISHASISATRGSMEVAVDYIAELIGRAAINYEKKHDGHYFWNRDIGSLLSIINSPSQIISKETMKIGFYTNVKVLVKSGKMS